MKDEFDKLAYGDFKISVVIPSYRVTRHIIDVILAIPPLVWRIYVIDDACPDQSGKFVEDNVSDMRVVVVYHEYNQGVGGAVMTGYKAAIADGADVIVKIDGDGQMDPTLINNFVQPILEGAADYTKGNRFFDLEQIGLMPSVRLMGNAILSFMSKLSSGYWDLFDPSNGYTAIHSDVASHMPFTKISCRYFFEADMLFRLNTLRAVVVDIPMNACYCDEVSNMNISKIIFELLFKHARNFVKRIFYNYYLRDLSLASLELPLGLMMVIFGVLFGGWHWLDSMHQGTSTPAGTVMLAALPALIGIQFVLAFFASDIASVPRWPIHRRIHSIWQHRK